MERRDFGWLALHAAAVLGVRTISASGVAAAGVGLAGCAGSNSVEVDPELFRGVSPSVSAASQLDARARSVAIIGSGYGAAVAALRLTEAGVPVTMFEMGRLWDAPGPDGNVFCPLIAPDGRAMWFKEKTEQVVRKLGPFDTAFNIPRQAGVLDVVGNEDMRVFCGRGVGGGSLVNLSVYVSPVREVFERVFPTIDANAMFDVYYPRAKRTLRAAMVPQSVVDAACYQYSRVGIAAAAAAGIRSDRVESGYDYDYMQREIAGTAPLSALGGEAAYGNNHGKRSLDKTYLADAMGTGLLTIHALHQVTRVTRDGTGQYVLSVRQIDVEGNRQRDEELAFTHVFLGGGSMGTSELLVRARERGDLPDLGAAVGSAWGPNSDIFVARTNPVWQPTGMVQATVPSSSFRTRDQNGKHVFSMFIPFPVGLETWISFHLVMTENPEAGYFRYLAHKDSVSLEWNAVQNEPAVRSARSVFDTINLANGSSYAPSMFSGGDIGSRATYHPVGGCPLGRATDNVGRLRPYAGLYVIDGSLIPVGIGANPALTIAALAERNIERIIAEDLTA
jgi:cholesterol oxidase